MTLQVVNRQSRPPLTQKEWEWLGLSTSENPTFDTGGTAFENLKKFLNAHSKVAFPTSLTDLMYRHTKSHKDIFCYSCKLLYASTLIGTGVSQVGSLSTISTEKKALKAEAHQKACENAIARIQEAVDNYLKPKEDDQKKPSKLN